MKFQIRKLYFISFTAFCIFNTLDLFSQDELDIVDPYEMKVSRSKQADTFYFTQNTIANAVLLKTDTIRTYDVFLEERPTPFGKAYMCNGTEVTKKKYLEYKQYWNASAACKPCMLYTYDDKNQLKNIAYKNEDCFCGNYIEFYQDKSKKVEGQFKQKTSLNPKESIANNLCNIRDGLWIYYLPNGIVEKTESYIDGKLKIVTNPSMNPSTDKKENTSKAESEEMATKKGLILRLKEKNK